MSNEINAAERRFVDVATLADRYGMSRSRVLALLDEAGVRPFCLSRRRGGTIRFSWADIVRYEDEARQIDRKARP